MKINDFMKDLGDNSQNIAATKEAAITATPVIITILPFLAMLAAILPSVIYQTTGINTVKAGIVTLLLTSAVSFYIRVNADGILDKKLAKTVITLSYLVSICLLLFVPQSGIFSFWMLGGLLVSMLIDNKLGLLLHFNLSFLLGIMVTKSPDQVIQVLIMGVIMSMLSGALLQKSTFIYAAIIVLSMNITLSFVMNNLIFNTEANYNYLFSLVSILTVLIIAFLFHIIYEKVGIKKKDKNTLTDNTLSYNNEEVIQNIAAASDGDEANGLDETTIIDNEQKNMDLTVSMQNTGNNNVPEAWTSYEVLCDQNNELMKKLKEHSESLYEHAVYIGDLSYRAAMVVGAKEKLAMSGGLYHEIGKIKGKNYIEEGLNIADEYSFPRELKAILKEHNIKSEKPGSVEAAIVMLSDSVVSTIDYIDKNDDRRFTTNKIIENIFQLRMEKGSFDSSSLTLKDYKLLKEFYQKEFGPKD